MPVADATLGLGGEGRIGVQGGDHVHPVHGVQVIEMNYMVLYVLDAFEDIA